MSQPMKWLLLLFTVIAAGLVIWNERSPTRGMPYADSFAKGSSEEWSAYGGAWRVAQGAMRNESDERGAKLITGSQWWKDYTVTTDVDLLGQQGDAGVVLRSRDEEIGVDAYTGYYVGLRSNDGALVIGYAEHGWVQLAGTPMEGGIQPFHWYRLRSTVQGCRVTATAVNPVTGQSTTLSAEDRSICPASGRVGLRSHSSGGAWKNLSITVVQPADLIANQQMSVKPLPTRDYAIDEPVLNSGKRYGGSSGQAWEAVAPVETIASLKHNRMKTKTALVRGTVVLTSPWIFVQDTTGGAAVVGPELPMLKQGDEVEVQGDVDLRGYSLTLRNARAHLLWARAPLPAISITAGQAATGAYDAQFVEVEGTLLHRSTAADGSLQFDLANLGQSFRAVVNSGRSNASLRHLATQSRVRIRGVCVVDPVITRDLYPFFLLAPSADDVEVLAGPPWWSARSLGLFGLAAIILLLLALLLYIRIDHWKLQAVLNERERIAHEMHDSLAQSFVGIGFQLQAMGNGPLRDLPEVNHQLELASELVRHSHEEARRSLMTLRREFLSAEPLHVALERFARRMVEAGTVEIHLKVSGEDNGLPLATKDALFRIGQESVANALRHGSPSLIIILFEYASTFVFMAIEDDGKGFDTEARLRGFGLEGIRKRAESIAAASQVISSPGQGTRVEVRAPMPSRLPLATFARYFSIFSLRGAHDERTKRKNHYTYR